MAVILLESLYAGESYGHMLNTNTLLSHVLLGNAKEGISWCETNGQA